jgi:hypothetical protein
MTRYYNVPLYVNPLSGAIGNDTSQALKGVKQIVGAYISFPPGTANLVLVQFFETGAQTTNLTGPTGGREITLDEKTPGYYAADGIVLPVIWQKKPEQDPTFIGMQVTNNSPAQYAISAQVFLSK